jgi:hypothetical protein
MPVIVVAASTKSQDFAVIDFAKSPPKTVMVSASAAGNVVDCYGKLAVVGDCGSGEVKLFDLSNPQKPMLQASVSTGLAKVTAISIDDTYVLAAGPNPTGGEAQLVLIRIASAHPPHNPQIVSTFSRTGVTGAVGISGVVIRGGNALTCEIDGCQIIDYASPSHPNGVGFPSSSSTIGLNGQVLGDYNGVNANFNGVNAVITGTPTDWNGTQPVFAYLFHLANGGATTPVPLQMGPNLLVSIAIAEIPDGGYYLATADLSTVTIQAFPIDFQNTSLSFPVPQQGVSNATVALKFLNNEAVPPLLAVANVTDAHGFLVTSNFLVIESNGDSTTLQRSTPNPVAKVALLPTLNPTIGITGWVG